MFDEHSADHPLRRFTQEDLLASGIRVALGLVGPVGTVLGEFLTQFVPAQRLDRLQQFIESLADRLDSLETTFKERMQASSGYAVLAEEVLVSAVRTASDEHRRDLASLLAHGLAKSDAELIEELALLRLRDRITDVQVILLMSYGNYRRTMGDQDLQAFWDSHPGLFHVSPPGVGDSEEERRRWTMKEHYESELEGLGLLKDTEGIVKSGQQREYEITHLGILLLQTVGRYVNPRQ